MTGEEKDEEEQRQETKCVEGSRIFEEKDNDIERARIKVKETLLKNWISIKRGIG